MVAPPPRTPQPFPTPGGVLDLDSLSANELRLLSEAVDLQPAEKARMLAVLRSIEAGEVSMLFKLPPQASRRDIKRAYFGLSKLYHPDRYFGRTLGSFAPILDRIFATLAQYVKRRSDSRALVGAPSATVGPRRRRHERHRFAVRIAIRCHSRGVLEGYETVDVGWGGVFVPTKDPAPVGDRVDVRLIVPGVPAVTMLGRVVHSRRIGDAAHAAGMGIVIEGDETVASVMQRLVALARQSSATKVRVQAAGKRGRSRRAPIRREASAPPI